MLDQAEPTGFALFILALSLVALVSLWFVGYLGGFLLADAGSYLTTGSRGRTYVAMCLSLGAFLIAPVIALVFIKLSLWVLAASALYAAAGGSCLGIAVRERELYRACRIVPFAVTSLFMITLLVAGLNFGLLVSETVQMSDLGETTIRQRLPVIVSSVQMVILGLHSLFVHGLWVDIYQPPTSAKVRETLQRSVEQNLVKAPVQKTFQSEGRSTSDDLLSVPSPMSQLDGSHHFPPRTQPMKVLLILEDPALARAAVTAIQSQSHEVVWIQGLDYSCNGQTADGKQVPIRLDEYKLAIVGTKGYLVSSLIRQAKLPFVTCLDFPADREFAIQEGAILGLPPSVLVQALRDDALNLSAAITWIPGQAAAKANAIAERNAVTDSGGWTGSGGWVRKSLSFGDYIAGLRGSGGYPGNIAEDITEPYFSRLAMLDLQDQLCDLGAAARIVRIEGYTAYCVGKTPAYNLRFRGCSYSFKSA